MREPEKLTLDRPATYEIRVPEHLDESRSDWVEGMTVTIDREGDGPAVTALTGTLDQAALQGLVRRLYSPSPPLIPVNCIECRSEDPQRR
jgi:hypothetical protein